MSHKAPGKHYRKGISLAGLFKMFPNPEAAEAWFAEQRWHGQPACPECGSVNVQSGCNHKTMPYRCREKECAKKFSVKTGTVMQGSNLDYQKWAIAMYLMVTNIKGVSSMKLHRDLEITKKAAWHLAHRLREGLVSGSSPFIGPVEADETYIGGKRKNMSNAKRKALKEAGAGRGAVDKTAVIGVKDRVTGKVVAKSVKDTRSNTIQGFVTDNTDTKATVYSDEARTCSGIARKHETVNHSAKEFVRHMAHGNGVESF
ncbi:MAG: IS1595 family transposase [Gammaproteobacteria bacterium]|nr:IS1595 family transposase [Gammaproteobacteria bacterium]